MESGDRKLPTTFKNSWRAKKRNNFMKTGKNSMWRPKKVNLGTHNGYPVISHMSLLSKSHMCNLSMYQKSMYLKAMSHIVSVLKVMGSKKSFPSKTHKYSA